MVISSLLVKKIANPTNKLKGIASVTLDGMFQINDIKIIEADQGMILFMPHSYGDVAYPMNRQTRAILERLIFAAYSECVVRDWGVLKLKLGREYKDMDFEDLSYEFYEIEESKIFIPEKSELIAV